jgi:hypothetical protein
MDKVLSGSEFDYREYVESELCRICWNFLQADSETFRFLPFYSLLFNPNNDNPFPPFTVWRKQRAMEIEIRKGVTDYTSEIQATLEAKRNFHKHILTHMEDFQEEQALRFMERMGGIMPGVWNSMYEQRREHELRKYQESFKRDTQNSPYPKLKIERELKCWSWVLFPEQVAIPPSDFVKRFESDASFQETRKFAELIVEGNAKFEQIGALERVGWRRYAMADARIQYREWLIENRGNAQIWEDEISNSVETEEIISQLPHSLSTNAEDDECSSETQTGSEHILQHTELSNNTREQVEIDVHPLSEAEDSTNSLEGNDDETSVGKSDLSYPNIAIALAYEGIRVTNKEEAKILGVKYRRMTATNAAAMLLANCQVYYSREYRLESLKTENNKRAVGALKNRLETIKPRLSDAGKLQLDKELQQVEDYLRRLARRTL